MLKTNNSEKYSVELEEARSLESSLKINLRSDKSIADEAKILNKYDTYGKLPEYEPYSLKAIGYQPLTKWLNVNSRLFESGITKI